MQQEQIKNQNSGIKPKRASIEEEDNILDGFLKNNDDDDDDDWDPFNVPAQKNNQNAQEAPALEGYDLKGISTIMVECQNVKRGCDRKQISLDDIDRHEREECLYRFVKCKRIGCVQQGTIEYKMLKIHHDFECKGQKPGAPSIIPEE